MVAANKAIFSRYGVLLQEGHEPVPVSAVYASQDEKKLRIEGHGADDKVWAVSNLNIFARSGRIYFRSRGAQYRIREIRDNDGLWLSKYRIHLSEDALSGLISIGGHMRGDEQLAALATDESAYVVALVYKNDSGTYTRRNGSWIKVAENDRTYSSMLPIHIDPARASKFLDLYDQNYVSVSDAQTYESSETKDPVAQQDRPAEEA